MTKNMDKVKEQKIIKFIQALFNVVKWLMVLFYLKKVDVDIMVKYIILKLGMVKELNIMKMDL